MRAHQHHTCSEAYERVDVGNIQRANAHHAVGGGSLLSRALESHVRPGAGGAGDTHEGPRGGTAWTHGRICSQGIHIEAVDHVHQAPHQRLVDRQLCGNTWTLEELASSGYDIVSI